MSESVDVLVSPANSFGFMCGGIDLIYRNFFGQEIEDQAKSTIKMYCQGELLVGQVQAIPTNNDHIPKLLLAPTMRTPTLLGSALPNPYLAMRGICQFINANKEKDMTISIPGMGTGVGAVPPEVFAAQARLAIQRFLIDKETWFPTGFNSAILSGRFGYKPNG